MSFTPNIPASGQTLGNSRTQVLNNFSSLRTTISNVSLPNHIDVNSVGAGKHIFVQMPNQTPSSANQPGANEGGLITRRIIQGAVTETELFFARDNEQSAGNPVYRQLTGPVTINGGPAFSGSTVLFGGIIIKWGAVASGFTNPITFSTPFLNNVFSIVCTQSSPPFSNAALNVSNVSLNGFSATQGAATGTGFNFYYIAIGN